MKMAIFYNVTSKLNSFKKFLKIRVLLKTFDVKLLRIGTKFAKVSDAKVHYFYTILPTSDEPLISGGGQENKLRNRWLNFLQTPSKHRPRNFVSGRWRKNIPANFQLRGRLNCAANFSKTNLFPGRSI